jgi:hypothetical protein
MCSKLMFCVVLALASAAYAREPKAYQTAKLLQMDSVERGMAEKEGKSFASEMLGTDSGSKKTHELLCQEYLLQSERVIYRIRPRDEKHPALLPVGEQAQFRVVKDKMLLRVEDLDDKGREYIVVSMTPRSDTSSADARASQPKSPAITPACTRLQVVASLQATGQSPLAMTARNSFSAPPTQDLANLAGDPSFAQEDFSGTLQH